RLDATPLTASGGATVVLSAATDLTPTGATLNGEIGDIGDGAPSVTLYWGTTDGGLDPGSWEHSLDLPGTWSGAFSAPVSGLEPGATYYFNARATNSAGVSWSPVPGGFETPPLPPQVAALAATEI